MEASESFEALQVARYVVRAESEVPLTKWWGHIPRDGTLFVAQGFEERGLGVLRKMAAADIRVPAVVLGKYTGGSVDNDRFATDFEALAARVSSTVSVVGDVEDGSWVSTGLQQMRTRFAVLDISALSNSALFPALDELRRAPNDAALAYSEAASYRPTKADWRSFRRRFPVPPEGELGSDFDSQPALYGGGHRVALCPNHEGYDTPGAKLALLAFLPFKAARLAALMSWADYAKYILVVGRPRLRRNAWRMEVLREVNGRHLHGKSIIEAATFGYLITLQRLMAALVGEHVLEECNVHLSPIGSKLQNVACWVLTTLVPSISAVVSVPERYYPEAYSEGVGGSWAFRLRKPHDV